MNKKWWLVIGILGAVLLCCVFAAAAVVTWVARDPDVQAGIRQAKDDVQAMVVLQQDIASAYPCGNVEIRLVNGRLLSITLVNSELNDLPADEQREQAKEVARFARDHFAGRDSIEAIAIELKQQQNAVVINLHASRTYRFLVEDLDR